MPAMDRPGAGAGWREALCKLEGRPNVVTVASCISRCEKASQWQLALVIFGETPRELRNVVTYGAALSALKRGSCWPEALGLLQSMEDDQVQPNVITFNAAISCCAASGSAWPSALRLLEEISSKQLQADVISCSSVISACRGAWQQAMKVLEFMHATSMRLDVISYNSAITSCEKSDTAWPAALQLLRSMAEAKLRPVTNSYNAAISACGDHWQHALLLLQELGPSADAVSYAACISSCGGAHWDIALHLTASASAGHVDAADAVTLAAAQHALLRAGKWRHALWLLDEMPRWSLNPQTENLHMAISACDRGNLWPVALVLLHQGGFLTLEGFNAAINAQRGSAWRQAIQLLELAPSLTVQPDLISYSAAMNACARSWPCAVRLLQDLRRREIASNALTMSSCLRACAMGHQWQVSLCLFEEMLDDDHVTLLTFCDLLCSLSTSTSLLRACSVADDMETWLLCHLPH